MRATFGPEGLNIPPDLYEALGSPSRISLTRPDNEGGISLRIDNLRARSERLARRLLRRGPTDSASLVSERDPSGVLYRTSALIPPGTFGIANYGTFFYLIPTDIKSATESRELSWATIEDYHEHREFERQDESAHQVSYWLARQVVLPAATVEVGSLYDLSGYADGSFDVVFTSGVLMHVPHDSVEATVREMHRLARRAVVHFELDGPSNSFDFHRYPRNYSALYQRLDMSVEVSYETFLPTDFRSMGTGSFSLALLVARKPG